MNPMTANAWVTRPGPAAGGEAAGGTTAGGEAAFGPRKTRSSPTNSAVNSPAMHTAIQAGGGPAWPVAWAFCHAGTLADPDYGKQRTCAEFVPPAAKLGPHVAPLGMRFYTGSMFPEQYRNAIFIAEHGSWNRPELNGYKVVFIRFENGRPAGAPMDFVTGFLKDGQARGRPVGVAVDKAGALVIADDVGNVVWRVTATPGG